MGVGSSKTEKKEQPKIEAKDLKILLEIAQKKNTLYRNKKVDEIKRKKEEIAKCLVQNNMDLANAKMNNLLKDEDLITICDILNPIFEIIKEKCPYIISSSECPADLRAPLDTVLYAATRMEVDGFMQFREKIIQKYGIAYVEKAGNNEDKFVNQNVVEKLKVTPFTPEMIKIRIKQLCKEKKLNIKFDENIVGGDWEPQIGDPNLNKNPYASMRPNLPTQSFVQQNSGNVGQGDYPTFGPGQQPPSQGGFPMPDNQGGFPQPNPYQSNQGGFPQPSPYQSNQGGSNQPNPYASNQGGSNQPNPYQSNQGGANQPNPYTSNQGGFPQPNPYQSNNGGFPQPSNNGENNNLPSASFINQIQNNNDVWNKTVGDTIPISEKSSHLEQSNPPSNNTNNSNNFDPHISKNFPQENTKSANVLTNNVDDLFIKEANATIYNSTNNPQNPKPASGENNNNAESQNMTAKTMKASLANPDNKVNPFINEENPFDVPTIQESQSNNLKTSSQKQESNSGVFDMKTVEEEELKKINISSQKQDSNSGVFDMKTIPEEDLKKLNVSGQNTSQTNKSVSPLDIPTLPVEEIQKLNITDKKVEEFDPNANFKDPFDTATIPMDEEKSIKESGTKNGLDPCTVNPFKGSMA